MDAPTLPAAIGAAAAVRRYDRVSLLYPVNAMLGAAAARMARSALDLRPGQRVLEVGLGTGRDLAAMALLTGPDGRAVGLDPAAKMLGQARHRLERAAVSDRVSLVRGDGRRIPLAPLCVDAVLVSRLLDLLDAEDSLQVLAECFRVLRPGGRVVLVNMSKPTPESTWFERCYRSTRLFGGWLFASRPVLAGPLLTTAGFTAVTRTYRTGFPMGSEIATGVRPPNAEAEPLM